MLLVFTTDSLDVHNDRLPPRNIEVDSKDGVPKVGEIITRREAIYGYCRWKVQEVLWYSSNEILTVHVYLVPWKGEDTHEPVPAP